MPRSKEFTIRCMRCDKYIRDERFWDAFNSRRELCEVCEKQFDRWMSKGRFVSVVQNFEEGNK